MDEAHIRRYAQLLLDLYGPKAGVVAAERAQMALARGKTDDLKHWFQVARMTVELTSQNADP